MRRTYFFLPSAGTRPAVQIAGGQVAGFASGGGRSFVLMLTLLLLLTRTRLFVGLGTLQPPTPRGPGLSSRSSDLSLTDGETCLRRALVDFREGEMMGILPDQFR